MNNEELLAATAVNAWKVTIDQLDRLLSTLTDEQLQARFPPTGIAYITSSDTSQPFTTGCCHYSASAHGCTLSSMNNS